jgi:hypothetical protein
LALLPPPIRYSGDAVPAISPVVMILFIVFVFLAALAFLAAKLVFRFSRRFAG